MQVIAVPNAGLEGLARRLAFQIGESGVRSSSAYTVKDYCDSEPSFFVSRRTSAAVVFLGKSETAEDMRPIPPQRFDDHGVSCFRQGRRAGIDASLPADSSALELVNLCRSSRTPL